MRQPWVGFGLWHCGRQTTARSGSPQRKILQQDWCVYQKAESIEITKETIWNHTIDVKGDIVVREEDCGTKVFKTVTREDSIALGMDFEERVFGRTIAEDVKQKSKVLFKKGHVINQQSIDTIGT